MSWKSGEGHCESAHTPHGGRQTHTQHTVGREDQYLLCAAALLVCWALLLRAATSRWAVSCELQPVRVLLLLFPTSGSDFSSGRAKLRIVL